MERKICSHTQKNARLQLVLVDHSELQLLCNRKLIFKCINGVQNMQYMRFMFVNCVHDIVINQQLPMSRMTS